MNIKDLKSSFENLKQRVLKTEGQKAAAEVGKIVSAINEVAAEKNNADKYKLAIQKMYNAISKAEDVISDSEILADLQSLTSKLRGIKTGDSAQEDWSPLYDNGIYDFFKEYQGATKYFKNIRNVINKDITTLKMTNVANGMIISYNEIVSMLRNAIKYINAAKASHNATLLIKAKNILNDIKNKYTNDTLGKHYNALYHPFFIKYAEAAGVDEKTSNKMYNRISKAISEFRSMLYALTGHFYMVK